MLFKNIKSYLILSKCNYFLFNIMLEKSSLLKLIGKQHYNFPVLMENYRVNVIFEPNYISKLS